VRLHPFPVKAPTTTVELRVRRSTKRGRVREPTGIVALASLITVGVMKKQIAKLMVAVGFAGAVVAGTVTSCDDSNDNNDTTGIAGRGGTGFTGRGGTIGTGTAGNNGSGGTAGNNASGGTNATGGTHAAGGTGGANATGVGGAGGTNLAVYNMTLSGSQEVPVNASTATGTVMVVLNKTNGNVTVTGTFSGLSTPATAAHIHGPAAVGAPGPIIVPLTVTSSQSGTVTGSGTMDTTHMNDMLGGMTFVNIHSTMFPDGEIRAQIQ
jgi:hypothetical protein